MALKCECQVYRTDPKADELNSYLIKTQNSKGKQKRGRPMRNGSRRESASNRRRSGKVQTGSLGVKRSYTYCW